MKALSSKSLNKYLKKAREHSGALLSAKQFSLDEKETIPRNGGIYLIYENRKHIIYVGIAKNLQDRILNNHLSPELNGKKSAFRRSLNKKKELEFGPDMRDWIRNKCTVAFINVDDHDMRALVEAMTIICLRSTENLLNK